MGEMLMKDTYKYYFIIDTNKYAGNFERQMCAFITGEVGDCGVGCSEAETAMAELDEDISDRFSEVIGRDAGDDGCHRPCKIYPSKNNKYNSLAIIFCEELAGDLIRIMKDRSHKYSKKIKVIGFRLVTEKSTHNEEVI